MVDRMRRPEAGSDQSVQATAEDAASGKLSAASLGYFEDPFLPLLVGTPSTGHVRRLPPIMNRGNFARVCCMEKLVLNFLSERDTPSASTSTSAAIADAPSTSLGLASSPSSQVPLDRKGKATEKATANEEGEGGEGGEGGKTEEGKGAGEGEGEGGKTETADRGGDRKGKAATPLTLPFGRRPQVISLGAGKDSLFFRLKNNGRAPSGGYFEVDFEPVVTWKAKLIERTPVLSTLSSVKATTPREQGGPYSLVTADLRDTAGLERGLQGAGVNFSAPTVILAECVLVYMEPHQSLALLQWCACRFGDSLLAAYEMTSPADAFGRMMKQNIQMMGCLLPGLDAFPSLSSQQDRFVTAGWDTATATDMLQVFQTFLDQDQVRRASTIEMLDEIEEWELIMRHYCLVVAAKGEDAVRRLSAMPLAR